LTFALRIPGYGIANVKSAPLLLAVAAPGSEDGSVEVGGRPVGGDAVGGRNVRLWRRSGLLRDLHRRGLNGGRLRCAVGGLTRSRRACGGGALLNRRDRLSCDGLSCDGLSRLGGHVRCGSGGLARTEHFRVEIGGRALAGETVPGLVRLLALVRRLIRRLGRRRVVRRRAAASRNRNGCQRNGEADARQCASQEVPPGAAPADGPIELPAIKLRYGAGKAKNTVEGDPRQALKMARGPALVTPNPSFWLIKTRFLHANRKSTSLENALEYQPACKPGSVGPRPLSGGRDVTAIPLGQRLRVASSNLPGQRA
jgi:hypothetical protein